MEGFRLEVSDQVLRTRPSPFGTQLPNPVQSAAHLVNPSHLAPTHISGTGSYLVPPNQICKTTSTIPHNLSTLPEPNYNSFLCGIFQSAILNKLCSLSWVKPLSLYWPWWCSAFKPNKICLLNKVLCKSLTLCIAWIKEHTLICSDNYAHKKKKIYII